MALYHPSVFEASNIEEAKAIILTDEGRDGNVAAGWELETPYVLDLIDQAFALRSDMTVLDHGCGIGRMARPMIERSGCQVVGVDTSQAMRRLATEYVQPDRFLAMSPQQFDGLVRAGLRVDAAISIWVLQHCFDPAAEVERFRRSLTGNGRVFMLNMPIRAVPVVCSPYTNNSGFTWASNGLDVAGLLRENFNVSAEGTLDMSRVPHVGDAGAFWMDLRLR